jgi:hypothetical protein
MARTTRYFVLTAIAFGALSGCGRSPRADQPSPLPVGADRDQHGCIASAGYAWCAREASCVRPFELAQDKGLEDNAEAFAKYCASTSP